jgi:hypothetical protein
MRAWKFVAGLVGVTCFLAGAASAQTVSSIAKAAEKGVLVSAGDVADIYQNQTWQWKDGAGYFKPQKRQFTAWSGTGKAAVYGEGVWFLKEDGTICFRAKWKSAKKSTTNYSCFEHRRVGNTIYAKNTAKGDWYILTGGDKQAYQEIKMLKAGDRVSKRVQEIKDAFARPATAG